MRRLVPLGAAALGWAVEALRLRKDVATKAGLGQSTVDRFLNSERVSDANAEAVLRAVVGALFTGEVLAAFGIPEVYFSSFVGSVVEGVKLYLGTWNHSASMLNSTVVPVAQAEHRLLPWVRLVLIDLAVRFGAFLRARNLSFPSDDFVAAASEGKAFAHALELARSTHRPPLTHEQLHKKARVGKNQPAAWLSGTALPQSETIRFIAAALAEDGSKSEALVEFDLRVAVAASALVRALTELIDPERTGNYVRAFFSLAEHVDYFLSQSRYSDDPGTNWSLVALGARNPNAAFILRSASRNTLNQLYIGDLLAAGGDWTSRLTHWAQILANPERAAQTFSAESGMSVAEAQEGIQLAAMAMLTLPQLGIPDGIEVVRFTGDDKFKARNRQFHFGLARARADHRGAETHARRMVELEPKNAQYHFDLAVTLSELGHPDEAIVECEIAAQLDPSWEVPKVEVGIIQLNHGRTEAGVETLERLARTMKTATNLLYNLGVGLMRLQRIAEAAARFEAVLLDRPDHAFALDLLAHCLLVLGDPNGLRRAREAAELGEGETLVAFNAGVYTRKP